MPLYCPNCGKQNTVPDPSPNGGDLYVAEDTGASTEFYDEADPYRCNDCNTNFYLNANTKGTKQ